MIPETIILGTIRVPTILSVEKKRGTLIICGGPFAMTIKGEFYRDQLWGKIENPIDGTRGNIVHCRIFGDHYFLYRTHGGPGKRSKIGNLQMITQAFKQFMDQTKEAIAA